MSDEVKDILHVKELNISKEATISDTKNLNLGHADSYIKCDSSNFSPGYYLFKGSATAGGIAGDETMSLYANAAVDGSGNWEPELLMGDHGHVHLKNTSQGNVGDKYFSVDMTDGMRITKGNLSVDQNSTTGAMPVLILDQADVSEEMIEFVGTIGVGNAIEAVGGKTLTTTHFIKVTLPGSLTRYIPVGTIA
jgi:hypothetical protein